MRVVKLAPNLPAPVKLSAASLFNLLYKTSLKAERVTYLGVRADDREHLEDNEENRREGND